MPEKECNTKIVTMTPTSEVSSPDFHHSFHFGHSSRKLAKHFEFWGDLRKTAEMYFQNHVSIFEVAMVTKGGRSQLKNIICFVDKNTHVFFTSAVINNSTSRLSHQEDWVHFSASSSVGSE